MNEKLIFIHFIDGWTCNVPSCPTFIEFEELIKWMKKENITKDMLYLDDDIGKEGLEITDKHLTIKK